MFLNRLVIGDTAESALYALLTESYFVSTRKIPYLFFENLPFSIMGFNRYSELWSRLNFMMGLLGKKISIKDESLIKIDNDKIKFSSSVIESYNFTECIIFDTTYVSAPDFLKEARDYTYYVIDDYEVSRLGKKYLNLNSLSHEKRDFAKQIHFYSSSRIDGANYITDCVMTSFLTKEQLYSYEYSDSMGIFAIKRHLESLGINGVFMNYYKNGKPKYRKPKIKHVKRIINKLDNSIYEGFSGVNFVKNMSFKEILNDFSPQR